MSLADWIAHLCNGWLEGRGAGAMWVEVPSTIAAMLDSRVLEEEADL